MKNHIDELIKSQAQTCAAPVNQQNLGPNGYYRSSPAEEAEKNAAHYREQAHKAEMANLFFRAHPEFAEFIGLIRTGAISV